MAAAVAALPPATPTPDPAAVRIARLEEMLSTAPDQGGLMYELAVSQAAVGRNADAIRWLEKAVALGYDFDLAGDPRFARLRKFESFRELSAKLAARPPARHSVLAFRLEDRELVPEGIAWDPVGRQLYVGSLHEEKILRVSPEGVARDFVASGQDGLWTVLGLRVDPPRRLLWAASAADRREGAAAGSSGLFAFDLETGKLRARHLLDDRSGKHLLNDIAVTPEGEVFVTDSESGGVWRLRPGGEKLEPLLPAETFVYPNGVALDASGARLYVADFARGISIVEIATGKTTGLPHPKTITLHSVDGLSRYGSSLVAIQNGPGMERVVQFLLDQAGDRVTGLRVIESRNPELNLPTTGAIAGRDYYYIANSGLEALGEDGKIKPGVRLEPCRIMKAALE